ncbi:MAG: carbamoyl-phosphate synthase large subunit [Pseudomonadota bacterium]|nr:carbamoyl-phosphate synthase large subunit [Pseudomonadota bacterium]MDE3037549.1 carbamoyl-phosphate synthase large subunit [Pseudomonadota bacterium]
MPKRTDINSILVIGAGPIVIGQACEFDYSGTQAVKTLKAEGYRVVLVNSNPATIMTDPELADATYIEPITPEMVEKIIAREKPDALLPTMGGQTALNCAKALAESGVLRKYNVELIGARLESINKAEDRELFNRAMNKIGLCVPKNAVVKSMDEARRALERVGLPAIIRPSFTMGGAGGGIAYNREEFEQIVVSGLDASPIGEVLIDESVLGWKEYEMEVVRDKADNCIIVCSIENIDPMGVHTGDSITVAPALTLTDKEYQIMRDASFAVLREIGVDTGGSNVQFAVNPKDGRMVVIEMNPRVSRSSALASKATGFPIAKVAAKLAVGYTLDEIKNDITGGATPASFEPTIDYIVTKIPRFTFEKFPGAEPILTTSMKSVGEAMAMGRNFQESLQKALRSLETGLTGLDEVPLKDMDDARSKLGRPTPDRLLVAAQALRMGLGVEEICAITKYDPWFVRQIAEIVATEKEIKAVIPAKAGSHSRPAPRLRGNDELYRWKRMGFSDARIAGLCGCKTGDIAKLRDKLDIHPVYKRVDTCAAEFDSQTPYMYSTYEHGECESEPTDKEKIIILGGGPNRIGQGIEFDYCCVHAAYALKEAGYETIMVNCNPETVSTDYDTSDRLYFEPLTAEDVFEIIRTEKKNGKLKGVIVQFGGQTPLKLARPLEKEFGKDIIIGTSPDSIDLAEDRDRFRKLVDKLKLKQPKSAIGTTAQEVVKQADNIGFPLLVRPSYVLGGRAMKIMYDKPSLEIYVEELAKMFGDGPILIDSYLQDATELDVDCLSDGKDVFVAGIMQHIEEAGIHSGDSACSLPPYSLSEDIIAEVKRQTKALARALKVIGLMNVQFAIKDNEVYLIEVNPRASRTVPFVAKATGVPVAKIAARVMAGERLSVISRQLTGKDLTTDNCQLSTSSHVSVKESVFPFARFPGVDVILGPEMKSTGEAMGIDRDFPRAFAKSQLSAGGTIPQSGCVFVSVKESDKPQVAPAVKKLLAMGFSVVATRGTAAYLQTQGLDVGVVNKVREGRPHIVDMLKDNKIALVINTTEGGESIADSFSIRRTALLNKISYYTTVAGARACTQAIEAVSSSDGLDVKPIQDYFAEQSEERDYLTAVEQTLAGEWLSDEDEQAFKDL